MKTPVPWKRWSFTSLAVSLSSGPPLVTFPFFCNWFFSLFLPPPPVPPHPPFSPTECAGPKDGLKLYVSSPGFQVFFGPPLPQSTRRRLELSLHLPFPFSKSCPENPPRPGESWCLLVQSFFLFLPVLSLPASFFLRSRGGTLSSLYSHWPFLSSPLLFPPVGRPSQPGFTPGG